MTNRRQQYIDRRSRRKFKIGRRAKVAWKSLGCSCLMVLVVWSYMRLVDVVEARKPKYDVPATDELLIAQVPADVPSQEVDYHGFHVSFNRDHHVPNYVSWELTREKAEGTGKRISKFQRDPRVEGCPYLEDYKRSGYDRGHMAPAADMKWDSLAMLDCHYLTNMVPQDHGVNQGIWNTLELQTRKWVNSEGRLIIFSGPILTDECPQKIGKTGVTVPERLFKIIYAPDADPQLALAFIVPNSMPTEQYEWYNVSVDEIEELTGLDFFASLPDSIEFQLERSKSMAAWKNRQRLLKYESGNIR